MKKHRLVLVIVVLFAFGLAFALLRTSPVQAHEPHTVGPYIVALGWQVEPAYVGVFNGPEMYISQKDDSSKKIEGAEKTLKLEIKFGDKSKVIPLQPFEGDPGHYTSILIPTRPGDYTFHLTGTINDTKVDETYSSSDGKFSAVEPVGDVLFPDTKASVNDLQAEIDALKADVAALKAAKK